MQFKIIPVSRRPPWPLWAVGIVLIWTGLGACAVWLSHYYSRPVQLCLIRNLTGVPCPTCGFTRGTLLLLKGHILQAWLYNPLLFSVIGIYGLLVAFRIICARGISVHLTKQERAIAWVTAVVLAAANWAYVIFREICN
jgi:hypothetical protein